jgi:hypothetical protein
MTAKRIPQLDAITGASTANDDNLVIFDTSLDTTKRILRSQLAIGLVGDLPYTPSGGISATTIPTAIAELDTEKQPLNTGLTNISGLSKADGNIIVGDGTNWVAESGATARTSLGLGTGNSPQFTAIELGDATDTTITRVSAGIIAVEGSNVLLASNIGTSVQAYDADTAKIDVAQTFSTQQTFSSGLVLQTIAAADIAAVANTINTTGKVAGKVVYDTTNHRLMIADGAAAADPWYVADGSAFVTPA